MRGSVTSLKVLGLVAPTLSAASSKERWTIKSEAKVPRTV